jgi:hypothetical protein
MVILHLLCVVYLVASLVAWIEIVNSPESTTSGPHVPLWYALPIVISIYALTL